MKNFLALYLGTPSAIADWNGHPEAVQSERRAAGIKTWHEWGDRNRSRIVEMGAPLGKTKRVSTAGVADVRNAMTGFTIVSAESLRRPRSCS